MDTTTLWHILQTEMEIIKKETDAVHHSVLENAYNTIKRTLESFLEEQVISGLPHPHPRSRVYRSEPKLWQIKSSTSNELLNLIIDKSKKCTKPPVCVFDLDGTLFDVGYRTLGIIQEWLSSEASKQFNEAIIKKVTKVNYQHIGYSLSHAFENAGFDLRDRAVMDLFSSLEKNWKNRFFDGKSLLKYDALFRNSPDFVNKLHENGIGIFYLTGRHYNLMYNGTIEQLKKFSFPFNKSNLILKKSSFIDDQIFKSEEIKNISKNHSVIGNFENEYLNLAFMCLEAPDAIHVIVDSQHSGRPTPELKTPIYRINGFE